MILDVAIKQPSRASAKNAGDQFAIAVQQHRAGHLAKAETLYRAVLARNPKHIGAWHNLGLLGMQTNRPVVAIEGYAAALELDARKPDWHSRLALAQRVLGRLDDAIEHFRRAIELEPERVETHLNLAGVLAQRGKADEAVACYRRALALKPDAVEAHHDLGVALLTRGQFDQALAHFQQALTLDPNLAQAHLNIGNLFLAQGRFVEAEPHYQRGLAINADFPKAQHSLGLALAMQGKLAEAVPRFERAVALKADFSEASNDLARTLYNLDRTDEALRALARAIACNGTAETKGLFVQFLRDRRTIPQVDDLQRLLVQALSEPWARPGKVGLVAAPLIKNDATLRRYIARAATAWPRRLSGTALWDETGLAALSEHRLLGSLLKSAPVCDVALERFLTNVRFALLEMATTGTATAVEEKALDFCCSLAQQCFLNEYVYVCTDEESDRARSLHASLTDAIASDAAVPALRLAVAACYSPLHSFPRVAALLERSWPKGVTDFLRQQVQEPEEERQLRRSIPVLTPIEDAVSVAVRHQYEENPFPRWVKCEPPGRPWTIDQFLRSRFPAALFRNLGKANVDILIAGCGTGQQAIETAQRFPQARLLAVDLSLSSLAHAKRHTLALGLERIDYAQADILKLASVGRSFDVIVTSGVLHHLAEPFAGWRVLLSLLRPGGVMAIGLYSELARGHVRAARSFIAERGYQPTAEAIRLCRQELMGFASSAPHHKVVRTKDFFSTSECRDLLFHVQEHRLTLPQIDTFLSDSGLTFLGFDLGERQRAGYRAKFPGDPAMTDLGCWDNFERENPDTFVGMYQFWVQAAAS